MKVTPLVKPLMNGQMDTSIFNLEGPHSLGHLASGKLMDGLQCGRGTVTIGARLNAICPCPPLPQGLSPQCGHWDTKTHKTVYLAASDRLQLKLQQKRRIFVGPCQETCRWLQAQLDPGACMMSTGFIRWLCFSPPSFVSPSVFLPSLRALFPLLASRNGSLHA